MPAPDLIRLLGAFADASRRVDAATELAAALGIDRLLVFVRDPELGSLIPARGFPQTVHGGPRWRAFVRSCTSVGRHAAEVEGGKNGSLVPVVAHVDASGVAMFFFGSEPTAALLAQMMSALPLLGGMLRAEHSVLLAQGEAAVARATGRHANDLAMALDAARVDVERALAESARLNAELEERDRRKDDFLAMLGHELRNPMAAISGAIEVMRARPDDAAQIAKARGILERQADQLARLVDDLLDVARITRGKVVLRLEAVEVGPLVRRAVEAAQRAAEAKAQSLDLDVHAAVHANADRTRLEQMVANLLTNAIKYTDSGGHIRVTVRAESDDAVIAVTDDGIGIAPELLPRIFDAFHQIDPEIDRAEGGLGVGLTVVRRLTELHHGRVEVTSEIGKGSTFMIRIPKADPPRASVAPPRSEEPAQASKKRILVVDDNIDSGEMLAALADSWGHDAHHAIDGPNAVRMALELRPDVVLLDIGLPGMDGYEVAARLRAEPATSGARIVAVSGYGQESDRVKSRAAGCDDHLVKPVDMPALRHAIGDRGT